MGVAGRNGFLAGAAASPSAIEVAEMLYKTPALVCHRVRCGKPTCRCAAGEGHGPYHFLLWRQGRIQRRRYVKLDEVAAVRAIIEGRGAADRADRLAAAIALRHLREVDTWLRSTAPTPCPPRPTRA